jgi:hypothetical protein
MDLVMGAIRRPRAGQWSGEQQHRSRDASLDRHGAQLRQELQAAAKTFGLTPDAADKGKFDDIMRDCRLLPLAGEDPPGWARRGVGGH